MRQVFLPMLCGLTLALSARGMGAVAPSSEDVKFFEAKVRPLLVEHCYECHGGKKQKGGLRLDSAAGVDKGGKNGAVVVAGKPDRSRLIVAVSYRDKELQMPPDDEKLSEGEVAVLTRWVEQGAVYPSTSTGVTAPVKASKKRVITDVDREFWSFQPPKLTAPPPCPDAAWNVNDVDRFVFAKLAAEGIAPAARADKVTLVRRAYLDAHGLPPTPEQVDEFVNDSSADAWEKLVDRLLASPRYGERMAQHWLDLVRYAESDGYRQDAVRTNVWPYRDYVIRSFNADKPYDRFVREQLAGDEIAPSDPDVLIGTAFLRHGVYEYNQRDVRFQWKNTVDEITDVTADAFLGLSMGCAKCHDHKFDPILQADYFRLHAFFEPILPRQDMVLATSEAKEKYAAAMAVWREKTKDVRAKLEAIERPVVERTAEASIIKFPEEIQAIIRKAREARTPLEEQIAELSLRQVYDHAETGEVKVTGKDKDAHDRLVAELSKYESLKPKPLRTAMLATDVGPVAPPTVIPGDATKTNIEPGYPVVLGSEALSTPPIVPIAGTSTGRRTALANWLTQPNHPLTTRVIVNRVWQYHFGRGLVGTSSDFGKLGDRPSHPELLDYLAVKLVENGWQLKSIHRLIMTSEAYRQTSLRAAPEIARARDPEDRWLWKYPARRLDAEQIRDSMLLVSGELKLDEGGPGVDGSTGRRSIYTKVIRNSRDPLLEAFDAPDTFSGAADRNRTTTATQSLLMFNGDTVLKRAEMFAGRLRQMKLKTPAETVEAAWRLAYSRAPTEAERARAVAFLTRPQVANSAPTQGSTLSTQHSSSVDQKPLTKSMPQLGSQAIYVRNARPDDLLRLADSSSLPTEDFTVEAYVLLDSIYENASVRVIASKWDGQNDHPGWSFGVTSAKSKHQPRNLILQLATAGGYEVIPSDFRLDLHKTYYVAVSVKLGDTGQAGVTFYVKDISDMDAQLKSVSVKHAQTGSYANHAALVIGGRDTRPPAALQGWDGLIDEVRLSNKALARDELLYTDGQPAKSAICAHWIFEDTPGLFKDSAGVQKDLSKAVAGQAKPLAKADAALVDLCHVILNSNAFLYVD
jgi:hypothetical protein